MTLVSALEISTRSDGDIVEFVRGQAESPRADHQDTA
ncbi:MAG: hypothetical protein J07HQX50_01728 [Haloquadratum sp. J07HQX50]|nr:MAG: hypothetical protein J07HQX50_01728 [Haloquadratum sp. J07HQX50]